MWCPNRAKSATRHTCATNYLQNRVDLRTVQCRLGHTNIKTTEAYLEMLADEQQLPVVEALSPATLRPPVSLEQMPVTAMPV